MQRFFNPFWRRARACLALVSLLLVTAVLLGWACYFRSDVPFLAPYSPASWILYPSPSRATIHPRALLGAEFRHSFSLDSLPATAQLRVRAFRACTIRLNGQAVPGEFDSERWKQESRLEIRDFLRAGQNNLHVTVVNSEGPPALWLALSCPDVVLVTDKSWEVSLAGATWLPAALAAEPARYDNLDTEGIAERVILSAGKLWPMWLIFAGVSLALVVLGYGWLLAGSRQVSVGQETLSPQARWVWISRVLFVLIAVFWTALFLHNSQYILPNCGFDGDGHLEYINHFRTTWSVPLPGEGWQMHHPPLYHFLAAVLLTTVGRVPDTADGILTIRLFNLALALVNMFTILACLRLIFPEHPRRWILGLIVAGFLPMDVYLYQFATNHILAGTLASVALYFVLRILCVPNAGIWDYVCLGVTLGFALLSMVTAGLLIPPAVAALAVKLHVDGVRWPRAVLRMFAVAAAVFTICGWYYVRVWVHLGTPFVANTGSGPGSVIAWWQDPGYRTVSDYVRFGECLRAPLFSALHGVWDGFYSTLWGDGDCGGSILQFRPPWSYDNVVAGMGLALLPTAAIVVGTIVSIFRLLRTPTIVWAFLLAVAYLVVAFLTYGTAAVPFYSVVKAFYGLAATVPLCALAALGLDLLSGKNRWLRSVIFVLLGTWALNVAASYWIRPGSPESIRYVAMQLVDQRKVSDAIDNVEKLVKENPDDTSARVFLARLYLHENFKSRVREVLRLAPDQRDVASRHVLLGMLLAKEGLPKDASHEFRMAMDLAPDDAEALRENAILVCAAPDLQAAIDARRNELRLDPLNGPCHASLAELHARAADPESARLHRDYLALADLKKTLDLKSKSPQAYNERGNAAADAGRYPEAIAEFDRAIELKRDFEIAYCGRGIAWQELGQPHWAIPDFNEAIRLDPEFAAAYVNRGNAHLAVGAVQSAYEDFTRAIELKPKLAVSYSNRGNVSMQLERFRAAIEDYDTAIELNPDYAEAFDNRGNAHHQLGELDQAIADRTRAIELNGRMANAYRNRAVSYHAKGLYREAFADVEACQKLGGEIPTQFIKLLRRDSQRPAQVPSGQPAVEESPDEISE